MTGIAGTQLTSEERERLRHPLVGGVILFTRNFESVSQLADLTAEIHRLRDPQLLIAVDQEGGRVQRFRREFTELPPPARLGELYDSRPEAAVEAAGATAWLMAAELIAVGVDFSFAPVLDIDRGISAVIGDRALGRDAQSVGRLGQAWARGMRGAGMAAVGKHFPGHGGVAPDSHQELPVDERDYTDLMSEDVVPFRHLVGNGLEAVMTAHVVYPAVSAEPAGFSPRWVEGVLRRELGFQGVVFSDDLEMAGAAVAGDMGQRARTALRAGCDMLLICNSADATDEALDAGLEPSPASALRLARLHGRKGASWEELRRSRQWHEARNAVRRLEAGLSGELDL
jgi:beta-N-acetylhexosaminidase